MDKPITQAPSIKDDTELNALVEQAKSIYAQHFNGDVWLGRCIFLSFYCSLGSCTFCFRSVSHKTTHDPKKALRSLGSVLSEALLIRAFGWRIEFLTGGYDILEPEKVARYIKLVKHILDEALWINLGAIPNKQLKILASDLGGVVASLETLEPSLHKKVCPDKPIEPYTDMLKVAKELGLKRSITLVIGLGEDRTHWKYVKDYLTKYPMDRITIYALRPVLGTPHKQGPSSQDMAWWIAKTRISFPKIEIIAGTANYRLKEVPLFLQAGANAITKLPATKMFNTAAAKELEESIVATGRTWLGHLTHPNPASALDFNGIIDQLELTEEEKQEVKTTLARYLKMMSKK